jgi:hypothetical protein
MVSVGNQLEVSMVGVLNMLDNHPTRCGIMSERIWSSNELFVKALWILEPICGRRYGAGGSAGSPGRNIEWGDSMCETEDENTVRLAVTNHQAPQT